MNILGYRKKKQPDCRLIAGARFFPEMIKRRENTKSKLLPQVCKLIFLLGFFLLIIPGSGHAQITVSEYKLKAVFLYNYARFVEWPPEKFAGPQSPFVIGVLGTDPFGAILDETVEKEMIGNRKLVVERYKKISEIKNCHILFIGKSEESRLEKDFAALKGKQILTVGEMERFCRRGGAIQFFNENQRIHLRIDPDHAENLKISSKLLRLADVVPSERETR